MRYATPLRYPGGKGQLTQVVSRIIDANRLGDGLYVEPFAGGAGVAMGLLLDERINAAYINDIDIAVFSFWQSILTNTEEFCSLIRTTPLTVEEWERQREVYDASSSSDSLELGFATFYLNRTNRSGILNGGVIGGKRQTGTWTIDARFNRDELALRVRRIARYRSRLHVFNLDAIEFLRTISTSLPEPTLLYLDPPYYEKGQHLYTNFYQHSDHEMIAAALRETDRRWIVSYDDHPALRAMYAGFRCREYKLEYSARDRRKGAEIMFFSDRLALPDH